MPFGTDTPESLRLALGGKEPVRGGHPAPEDLLAFRGGALGAPEADRLREHLSECPDCAVEMLELEALQGEKEPGDVASGEINAAWWRFRRGLPRPAARAKPIWVPWRSLSYSAGLAALILAFVSIGLWRKLAELERPRANPPIVQLLPAGALRAATPEEAPRVDLGQEPRLLLVLNPRIDLDLPAYSVEGFDANGRSLFRLDDVAPSQGGSLYLDLPRSALSLGRNRIVIESPRDRRPLEAFEVERVGKER